MEKKVANRKTVNQKVRKMSIRIKLLVPVLVVILAVCSLLSAFAYMTVQEEMVAMGQLQSQTVAALYGKSCKSISNSHRRAGRC